MLLVHEAGSAMCRPIKGGEIFVESLAFMTSSKDTLLGSLAGLCYILSGRDWIYVSSLLVPLVVYDLTLKAVRIHSQHEIPEGVSVFDLIRSDLLFNWGYALLWIGLFALAKRGFGRKVVVGFFHASAALVAATTTSAHLYFQETGSTLDLNIILYSLSRFGEIKDVIASVSSAAIWTVLAAVLYYAVLGPLVVTRLVCGRRDPAADAGGAGLSGRAPLLVCLAAVVLALLSSPAGSGGRANPSRGTRWST